MHENDFLFALMSRFHGFELVEFLDIPIEDIVERFMDVIDNNRESLEEVLGIND